MYGVRLIGHYGHHVMVIGTDTVASGLWIVLVDGMTVVHAGR